jgi:hypothetical protein
MGGGAKFDRPYFNSFYFREPGGMLFGIATDQPGFTVDEPVERLGKKLLLPPEFEDRRFAIQQHLPPLNVHRGGSSWFFSKDLPADRLKQDNR